MIESPRHLINKVLFLCTPLKHFEGKTTSSLNTAMCTPPALSCIKTLREEDKSYTKTVCQFATFPASGVHWPLSNSNLFNLN